MVSGSYEKAKETLGWTPKRGIEKVLEDLDRWYQNN
jgi:UDP-glucose 4-epimerase